MGDGSVVGTPVDDTLGEAGMGSRDALGAGIEQRGLFAPVYFDYDSAQINPSEQGKLSAVASQLSQQSAGLIVEGHCDERGSNEYNLSLGERRAMAVRAYLIGLGVPPDRIQTKSLGEEMPAVPGHDESAWSKNRRGEFVVVGQ
jgi:peptidoglycan-associated lipoprotein